MELFYFFLLLIVIAGAFYAWLCVKDVEDMAWNVYRETMLRNEMFDLFSEVAQEMQNDKDTLS